MNEKEAREILIKVRKGKHCLDTYGSFRYGEAKGYLERIAQEKDEQKLKKERKWKIKNT